MIAGILKTAAICLSSLGSFDMPKTKNALINTNATIEIQNTTGQLGGTYTYTDGANDLAVYEHKTGLVTTQNMTIQWIQEGQTTFFSSDMTVDPRAENDPTEPIKYFKNTKYLILKITNTQNVITMPQILPISGDLSYSRQNYTNPLKTDNYYQIYTSYDNEIEDYFTPINNPQNGYQVLTNELALYTKREQIYVENKKTYSRDASSLNEQGIPITDVINIQKEPNKALYVVLTWSVEGNQTLSALNFNFDNITVIMSTSDVVVEQEVIDLPGLCFEVLTMPFTFISTAFNLTIFPGTPYQVNLSNLFLSVIGILIFVFIMKKLIFK